MRRKTLVCAFLMIVIASGLVIAYLLWPSDLGLLAYVQSGDIYLKSMPQGQPRRLTWDGLNSTPRISPSGKWLAFRKGDGDLWAIESNGQSAHQIHPDMVTHYQWAPGRDLLAFVAMGELILIDAGQKDSRMLVQGPPQDNTGVKEFLWSQDGKWIGYEYTESRDIPEGEWPWRSSIRKVNVESGGFEEIVAYPPPDEEGVPGNTTLAAWVGSRIYLWQCEAMSASIMADGCPLFFIDVDKKQNDIGMVSLLHRDFLSFSPDSKILAAAEGADRLTWTNKRIALINLESHQKVIITGPKITATLPAWSPDGSHIAYAAAPDEGSAANDGAETAKRRIWIMRTDGSNWRQLIGDGEYREERPIWLGDGKHIIFAREDKGQVSVWLIQEDGKSLKKMADDLSPNLSVDEIIDDYGHLDCEKFFDVWSNPQKRFWEVSK